jgi:hypothetical protein
LDRDEGRFIHFEGTYTSDFSGNSGFAYKVSVAQKLALLPKNQI